MPHSPIYDIVKSKSLSMQQQLALENFYADGCLDAKKAFIDAGYNKNDVAKAIRVLKDELIQLLEVQLVNLGPKAVRTLGNILESEEPIVQVAAKLEASKTLLDRIGLGKKEQVDVNHNVSGGIFILPAKQEVIIDA